MDNPSIGTTASATSPWPEDFVIGVDIGGTKVAAGIVDRNGHILREARGPMVSNSSAEAGMAAVLSVIAAVSAELGTGRSSLRAIGVCCPGPLSYVDGMVLNPPNLPCWRNFPLAGELAKIYPVPVMLDNDANAAALAEVLWGAGRGYRNVFYATIGTGIGTGIVFDRSIYHGRTGAAAEGGHMSIDYRGPVCACGKRGCIEALAAGPAIAQRARAELASDGARTSAMLDLADGKIEAVTSETVGKAFAAGDRIAKKVLGETVELLSLWLGNIVDLLEPDVIVIGGGAAQMLSPFFPEIRSQLPGFCVNSRSHEIPIVMAHYGANAGLAGAAALCSTVPALPASDK